MGIRSVKIIIGALWAVSLLTLAGCRFEGNANPVDPDSEWKQIVDLSGVWKFSVGDNLKWAAEDADDESWERIEVPSSWENQGFHGYDGYAWYRNTFTIPARFKNSVIYLFLGFVDDVDQVFINGKQVGYSGSFPPDYETAYNVDRRYPVPSSLLKYDGPNSIAVRVYDEELEGGILSGNIGIYVPEYSMNNGINLAGTWKFRPGDSREWKDVNFDDNDWHEVIVPGYWENQGFPDYDGIAWYRKTVFVPEKFKDEKLILVMGKIDDIDEVYVNGKLVGSTGNIETRDMGENSYQKLRGYYLQDNVFNYGENNLVAVRVYDGLKDGGIYEGPLTIVTQKEYRTYWNNIRKGKNFIDEIFN
jgi:hypothetical protein